MDDDIDVSYDTICLGELDYQHENSRRSNRGIDENTYRRWQGDIIRGYRDYEQDMGSKPTS